METSHLEKTITCRIPNDKGDLVKNLNLKVTLNDPSTGYEWCPSVISHLIESAELLIGGQTIQKLTGEYIYMHQQLYNTDDDTDQTVYFLNSHGNTIAYSGDYNYFIDLPFYFYRNSSLSIPTCALTKQTVEVRIKLRPLSELVSGANPENAIATLKKIAIDTEFVFLTDRERDYLMSRPIDYVITQLQMSKFVMKAGEKY